MEIAVLTLGLAGLTLCIVILFVLAMGYSAQPRDIDKRMDK